MSIDSARAQQIEKIRCLPAHIHHLVDGLTPAQLTTPFLPDEWSVAQNIHHLADSHCSSYIRCKLIVTESNPTLKPYDQNQWAALVDASAADVTPSLLWLQGMHARWVHFWETLKDQDWERPGFHPENGTVTLADQLKLYAAHGEGHIDQIRRTLAAQYSAPPTSKPELMARIDETWAMLNHLLNRLSPADMEEPGPSGWSPRVQLAHITAWESQLTLSHLGQEPSAVALGLDPVAYAAAGGVDAVNALLYERHRWRPLAAIMVEAHTMHEQTVAKLHTLSWEEITLPLFPDDPDPRPRLDWIAGNTYEHYLEHWLQIPVV